MKRLFLILIAMALVGLGCESDSKKDKNDFTPVLDTNGQAATNAAGEPLFTDKDGNTGTEAELTADVTTTPQTGSGNTSGGGVTTTTIGEPYDSTGGSGPTR